MPAINVSTDKNQQKVEDLIYQNTVIQAAVGWIPVVGWVAAGASADIKNHLNDYLDDLDLMTQYKNTLDEIEGNISSFQNIITENQLNIRNLNREKAEREEWLEDYEQMLAGEGDEDNLLLQQDQLLQTNITNAENDLAAYADSSALELDALIQQGYGQYAAQRGQNALANVMAGAGGSVQGVYNSTARRQILAIRAFVGDDMVFNEAAEGTDIHGKAGSAKLGSYAKAMLSSRTVVRNNLAKYQTEVDAARFTFNEWRDTAEDTAQDNEYFLEDYSSYLSIYQNNINRAQNMIAKAQAEAEAALADLGSLVEDMNKVEDQYGLDKTTVEG